KAKASFLPPDPEPLSLSVREKESGTISGRFSFLAVTTLDKLLLSSDVASERKGALKLVAVEERPVSLIRAFAASLGGKLYGLSVRGVHFQEADEITIESDNSSVILDGETFRAERGNPIRLRPAHPLAFVKLAA
ncbi:MAG TPA: diacylglycerol kinase, partial [Sphingomicrobium sp.]|nr:diacylglycerol kinase [Sphingomicrobium sp.]